jgi:cell division protein FtsB
MALPKFEFNRDRLTAGAVLLVALLLVGGLVWAFGQQFALSGRMRVEEQRLQQLIDTELERKAKLESEIEYTRSDTYLERWARVEAKMIHPGEVLVVPVESEAPQPMVTPEPTKEPVEEQPEVESQSWWDKFLEALLGPADRQWDH